MRLDLRAIDPGAREAVSALHRIPGVVTRASCEGARRGQPGRRHAELAYVLFRYPLPLRFRDYLLTHLGPIARIEEDGLYSRWPAENDAFLKRLATAARAYPAVLAVERRRYTRCPLPRLRARVARAVSKGQTIDITLCLDCQDVIAEAGDQGHRTLRLLELPADQETRWFADFLREPGNALDATLVAREGWARLASRTRRGDFGAAFGRRWLRYRSRRTADLTTQQIRSSLTVARQQGTDIDFFYDAGHAVFGWKREG